VFRGASLAKAVRVKDSLRAKTVEGRKFTETNSRVVKDNISQTALVSTAGMRNGGEVRPYTFLSD